MLSDCLFHLDWSAAFARPHYSPLTDITDFLNVTGQFNDNDKCCFLALSTFIDFPLSVRVFLGHGSEGGGRCVKQEHQLLFPPVFLLSLVGKSMIREAVTGRKCMGNAENTFRKLERTGWDRGSSPGEHHSISIIGHFYMEKNIYSSYKMSYSIKCMTVNTCAPQGCCLAFLMFTRTCFWLRWSK